MILSFLSGIATLFIVLTPIWLVLKYTIEICIDGYYDITEWLEEEYKDVRRFKREWNSRSAGFKLALILTIYFIIARFVPSLLGMNWEWTNSVTFWWYPIPFWIGVCLVFYILGRIAKMLFAIIRQ